MDYLFSDRINDVPRSIIREILKTVLRYNYHQDGHPEVRNY